MRHLKNSIRAMMVLTVMTLVLPYSVEANAKGCNVKLTAVQCAKLRTDLDLYSVYIRAHFAKYATQLISIATADLNKVCPLPIGNNYSADTQFECSVADVALANVVSLGVDTAGKLVNVATPAKVACVSQVACEQILATTFQVFSADQTPRCSSPTDTTVLHLSDAQVQAQVNARLGM